MYAISWSYRPINYSLRSGSSYCQIARVDECRATVDARPLTTPFHLMGVAKLVGAEEHRQCSLVEPL